MALNFPTKTLADAGDEYTYENSTWVWNGISWNIKTGAFKTIQVTILALDWGGGTTVTKTVNGITPANLVLINPSPGSYDTFTGYQIRATAQDVNSLTFTCTSTPLADVIINVSYFN
jgi:hypothetical protein